MPEAGGHEHVPADLQVEAVLKSTRSPAYLQVYAAMNSIHLHQCSCRLWVLAVTPAVWELLHLLWWFYPTTSHAIYDIHRITCINKVIREKRLLA